MANTAAQLITLIMLLQRRPNQNGTQLAQELNVSVRTVQRYITRLEEMGIPIYAERGPIGGYSLVRGYKMPPMIFSPEEAVAIYLGTAFLEQVWGSLYQTAARGAMAKLDNVLPEEQRREVDWARRTLQATGITLSGSIVYGKQLEILWTAVHDRRRVRMRYRSWNQPEALQRDIDPYVLWHGWGWQYCVGYCHMRQDLRTFRLDRILEAKLLEQTFSIPADFDLEAHLNANQFFQQRFEIRLHFTPEAAVQALDNLGQWDTLEEQPDGSLIAAFTIPNLEIAASIVMTYGYRATVMEPEELRALVRERASALAARNNKENKYDN